MVYTSNHMSSVTLRPVLVTHTNDASVRFKTPRDGGLLFIASSRTVNSYLKAFIEQGRIKLETNMGETVQVGFNDSQDVPTFTALYPQLYGPNFLVPDLRYGFNDLTNCGFVDQLRHGAISLLVHYWLC